MVSEQTVSFLSIVITIVCLAVAAFLTIMGAITGNDAAFTRGLDIVVLAVGWVGGTVFGQKTSEVNYQKALTKLELTYKGVSGSKPESKTDEPK